MTKEQLIGKYLVYSPEITEDIFNRIIDKLKYEFFYTNNDIQKGYKYFSQEENSYLYIGSNSFHVSEGYSEPRITVKDILGEN